MCYFAITDYDCGDWKWGNMMERCPRQHRIGETCGAKLIHQDHVTKNPDKCKICQDIDVKRRRLTRLEENIRRWTPEREKFAASLDKSRIERDELIEKVKQLHSRRQSVQFRNGSDRGEDNVGGASALTSRSGSSYAYYSQGQGYPTASQMSSGYHQSGQPSSDQQLPPVNRLTPYSSRR